MFPIALQNRQSQSKLLAFMTGAAATVVVACLYAAGWLDWMELRALDLRFRYTNSLRADPRIVVVGVSDRALELIGRWPWSRDLQARLIDVLCEAGARHILVDINWIEHETRRDELPTDIDIVGDPLSADIPADATRRPDLELRQALRRAGNVIVATVFGSGAAASASPDEQAIIGYQHRIRAWLAANPRDPDAPHLWFGELFAALTDTAIENDTSAKARIVEALRRELGLGATLARGFPTSPRLSAALRSGRRITPIHFRLASAAARSGFVNWEPDTDGVVRKQALLVEQDGIVLPQLALAGAMAALSLDADDLSATPGKLSIARRPADGGVLDIQIEERVGRRGEMVIPWIAGQRWEDQFRQVSADAAWQVCDRRRMIAENERVMRDTRERVLSELIPSADEYVALLAAHKQAENALQTVRLRDDLSATRAAEASRRTLLDQIEAFEAAAITRTRARLAEIEPLPYAQRERETDTLEHLLRELEKTETHAAANRRLEDEARTVIERLRGAIDGGICLLGYTATATADMAPTPTHPRAPGVMAHASILNALLTGRTIRWAPALANFGATLLLGVLVSLIAAFRPLRDGAITTLALLLLSGGAAAWLFWAHAYWLAVVPSYAAVSLSFMTISLYRYAFADRERRQLANALSQYTSKAMARQMAQNPELCRRAETREVTAIFTDLRGFTPLSERVGATRTQQLLNICLGELTAVMLRHEAMVNKFIGDGIFAFWNPVIYPQADHARRACETALDLQTSLHALIKRQAALGGDDAFAELELRVGVATGSAVVGPCGSEQKYDYTCIGDSVNVASRLESANKFFGTHSLVSAETRAAAGAGLIYRRLGIVQVRGKRQPIEALELVGRDGQLNASEVAYAETFSAAVDAFCAGRWGVAVAGFETCRTLRAADGLARYYSLRAKALLATPPAATWTPVIELNEK